MIKFMAGALIGVVAGLYLAERNIVTFSGLTGAVAKSTKNIKNGLDAQTAAKEKSTHV